jgi:hypothetical protein
MELLERGGLAVGDLEHERGVRAGGQKLVARARCDGGGGVHAHQCTTFA